MKIFNKCCECGKEIYITRQYNFNPLLAKSLRESNESVCNICDSKSGWILVKIKEDK